MHSHSSCAQPIPKVAVLLAAYNGEQYIAEQIGSILAQTGVEVDIFISDDGSTDGTRERIRGIADQRVKLFQSGPGRGAGQNFIDLFRNAPWRDYDFVALSDQDDIWHPEKLLRATISIAEQRLDAYSGNVTAFWPNGRRRLVRKSGVQRQYDFFFEAAGPGNTYVFPIPTAEVIVSTLDESSLTTNVLAHDWLFYAIVRSREMKWWIDLKPYVLYRQHEENLVGAGNTLKRVWSRLKQLTDGSFFDQASTIYRISSLDSGETDTLFNLTPLQALRKLPQCFSYRRKPIEGIIVWSALILHAFQRKG